MLPARTPLDHMYVNVTLDILEMDETAQVNLIFLAKCILCTAPFSRVAGKLDNLSPITCFNMRLHPTFRCRKNGFSFYLEKRTFE